MRRLFFILAFTCCLVLSLAAQADRIAASTGAGADLQNTGAEVVKIGSGSNSVQLLSSTDSETTLQFNVGEFKKIKAKINSEDWYHILLSKEGKMLDAGSPELPVFNRSIIIGDNAKMKLEVYDVRYEDIKLPIAPSKGNLTRDIDPAAVPYSFGDVYQQNEFYPKQVATLSDPYIMRDVRGIVVRTSPFAYNPVTQTLRIYTSYKVRVYQDGIDDFNVLTTTRDEISRSFVEVYENHFLNWNPSRYTSISDSFGKFLIIYYDSFETAIQPLMQWKRQKGILGYYIAFSTVGSTAAQLQAYIQNYYTTYSVDFVILVGDAAQIPTLDVGGGGSDPSFALTAGADNYPDLFISRISATTLAEVTTQVDKIINYERDFGTNQTWIQWATGIASDQGPGDDGEYDYQHMNNIRTDLLGYGYTIVDQIYDPGATAADVTTVINGGSSWVNYCGHGSTTSFTTTGFSNTNVNALTNGVKTPIICSVACLNGNFVSYTCFAEAWLRKSGGGGIAFYGSSINQSWSPPMAGQDEVVDLLVAESKKTVGGLFFNGACKMLDDYADYNMFKTWNIFGDCSMLARTKNPIAMTVTHTSYINPGVSNTISVSTGVPYAYIGISIGSTIYAYGYANASGTWSTTMTPNSIPNVYTLTVTAYNRVTYVGNIYNGHIWDGSASNVWAGWANWNCNTVPTSTSDVLIPAGLATYPSTVTDTEVNVCNNLRIESGASVTVSGYNLTVYGNIDNWGQLVMNSTTDLYVYGYFDWESGSTASVTNSGAYIFCQGHMTFKSGSNVQMANGTVEFFGSDTCHLINQSSNTQLNNLWGLITAPSAFILHDDSTQPFVINGFFYNGSTTLTDKLSYCYYTGNVTVKGNFLDYGTTGGVYWFYGSLILDGTTQSMRFDGTLSYVNNLTISPTTSVTLLSNLRVKNKLRIESGVLNSGNFTITVGGDWENVVGPAAFTEGTSTVIFNGSGHQYCNYTENFNAIVVDKSGGALRVNNSAATLTCASYDWTAGAIDVLVGTFTANDLIDDGLYGSYYVNPGATINLYQATNQYVDLNGNLIFSGGGTINVYGGDGLSYWPFDGNGSITMSGGTLDFKDSGIRVYTSPSYSFTASITGGTIRTSRQFIGDRTDFNPTGGFIELYGSTDCTVSHGAGSNFYNLRINKTASRDEGTDVQEYVTDKFGRSAPLTRTNQVTAGTNLDINGYFYILAGTFVAPAQMNVQSHWYNNVGPDAFVEGTGLVVFDGSLNSTCDTENFYNLELNKTGTYYLRPYSSAMTVTCQSYNWTSGRLYVNGGTFEALDMLDSFIYGTVELVTGFIHFHQETIQYLDLQGDLIITGGELHLYGINGNTYWPYLGNASLTMSNGLIEIHDTGLNISSGYTFNTSITGGTIKIAKNLNCYRADFNPTGASVIDFYTAFDSYVNMPSGTLNNVQVHKAARSADEEEYEPVPVTDRDGNETMLTRSNTVYLSTNVTCQYMVVNSGSFSPNGYTLNSNTHFDTYGTVIMNNAASKIDAVYDIYWLNGSVADATLGTFECGGQWNVYAGATVVLPVAVNTYLLANTSRSILLSAAGTQFGTLYISGTTGTPVYTLHSSSTQPMHVTGNLTIGSGNELDMNLTNMTVNGNLDLDGKLDIHASNVTIDGKPDFATTSILSIDSGEFIFYDSIAPRDTWLRGNLSIISGTLIAVHNAFIVDNGSVNAMAGGSIICEGINASFAGTFQPAGGTVEIHSNLSGGIYMLTVINGNWLPNLTVNTSTGVRLADNLTVKGNINVSDGFLDLNAKVLSCYGNIDVYDVLEVDAGATLSVQVDNKSLNIKSGGRLDALGSSTSTAFFTNPPGWTNVNIESGATIAANYATFQWCTAAGVNVKPGAMIDPAYPFSNCTFKWSYSGTLLTLNNDQNLAIYNAVFINAGGESSNVKKTVNAGMVNFINATGTYAGEAYDDDVYDRVWWTTNAAPATPDVLVLKAEYSDLNPDIGETVTCTVTYVNASTTAAGTCYLDLYWNESIPPEVNYFGNQAVYFGSIPAGTIQQYVFNVTPDASWAGTWNSYVQIDADNFVAESNEYNNVYGPMVIMWNMVALPAIDDLSIEIAAGTYYKLLTWTYPMVVSHFNIYRSADPFFTPSPATFIANVTYPDMQYIDTTTADMYFYIVTAESGPALAPVRQSGNRQRRN